MTDKLRTTIKTIFKDAGITSEDEVLKSQAEMITFAKLNRYEAEVNKYRNKYQTLFKEFEKQLRTQKNEENFQKEDDYLDWRFAEEALKLWNERKEVLNANLG